MNLKLLRRLTPEFEEEFIIGRAFRKGELSGIFIGFTREDTVLKAWILLQGEEEPLEKKEERERALNKKRSRGMLTKRDELMREEEGIKLMHSLRAVVFGTERFEISSGSGRRILENSWEEYLLLSHFLKKIPSFGELENADLENMNLYELEFQGDYEKIPLECFRENPEQTAIILENDSVYRKIFVEQDVTFPLGEDIGMKLTFSNQDGTIQECYIENVYLKDIWAEEENRFQEPELKKYLEYMTMDEVLQLKADFFRNLEEVCPKGMYLPIVEYETKEEIVLDIYSKHYLNERVKENEGSASVLAFLMHSRQRTGKHGGKVKATELSAVSKEQKEFPAEIISYHKEIKVENVEF